jgi:hypothetical protein
MSRITEGTTMRKAKNERGIALILVLGLMLAISVVAVIVTLLAITERGLTASERQQRAAFEGAQGAVELVVSLMPAPQADSGLIATHLTNGVVIWNGDPADSVPGQRQLAPPGQASPQGMEYNVFAYRRYDVHGAGRYTVNGVIIANKGVRATVDVGPFVTTRPTSQ